MCDNQVNFWSIGWTFIILGIEFKVPLQAWIQLQQGIFDYEAVKWQTLQIYSTTNTI